MAKVFIEETTLTAIGDAIRGKTGKTELIDPANMSTEITAIEAGGGGGEDVSEVVLTGDASYACSGVVATAFIQAFPTKVSTSELTNIAYMFRGSGLESIPFSLNIKLGSETSSMFNNASRLKRIPDIDCKHTTSKDMSYMFSGCSALEEAPVVTNAYPSSINNLFNGCSNLRSLPNDFFSNWDFSRLYSYQYANVCNIFHTCRSLRAAPTSLFEKFANGWGATSGSYSLYNYLFYCCSALDEVVGLPVNTANAITSNPFGGGFTSTKRLKRLTFQMNDDGTPKVAQWKKHTIELQYEVGYGAVATDFTSYNSGITADKEVKDDASYQALKDDPDWWTYDRAYSRYNHDSAVETINSLPDTSAYLATAGGTNTIIFASTAGSATDGGAINTLTEEEIAVATAKGWTVTFS